MKYKNPKVERKNKFYSLEVSCAHCKTPVLRYLKGGKGGLIKLQVHRIEAGNVDFLKGQGSLNCHVCGQPLARLGDYRGKPTYWVIRGQINSRRLPK